MARPDVDDQRALVYRVETIWTTNLRAQVEGSGILEESELRMYAGNDSVSQSGG